MILVCGLPRSRTAWFTNYFRGIGIKAIHEGIKYIDSIDDYNYECDCTTVGWLVPKADKTVIIERDIKECFNSCMRMYGEENKDVIADRLIRGKIKYDEMDGLRIKFEDINDRLKEIHEFCTDIPYEEKYADMMKDMKIEVINIYPKFGKVLGDLCL